MAKQRPTSAQATPDPTLADGLPAASTPPPMKFDAGKLPLHLLPLDVLVEVTKVLQFGAGKYAPNRWRGGIAYSRVYAATLRHMFAWWQGEENDAETGLSHLAHALTELAFLHAFTIRARVDLDDRAENNA
jgi:Domain of unknown function (DUF5664)